MIEVKKLTVRLDGKKILSSLSFSIPSNGVIQIAGPSGVGKTTLLRALAGLLIPDEGSISGLTDRRIGVVFQEDRLLPWNTVYENTAMVSDAKTACTYLKKLDIWDAQGLLPKALSGGMGRRAALARAMAYSDDVLILDEPFNGLDLLNKKAAAAAVLERGRLLIYVSHIAEDAALLPADQVIRLA